MKPTQIWCILLANVKSALVISLNTNIYSLQSLNEKIHALNEKYATSYADIENEIKASTNALDDLVSQLTDDEFAIKGLEALIK